MVGFLSAYSSLSFGFQGTMNGGAHNLNMSYTVVYHSSTTYKVSVNFIINGQVQPATAWILNDGTVLALYGLGHNITGSAASSTALAYFSDLMTLNSFANQESTITAYFHSAGTSTAKVGGNTFTVTEYVANSTPETVQLCTGETATLNTYNVYIGTPSGSSLELVTYANFAGSFISEGVTTAYSYTYQLTGLTVK